MKLTSRVVDITPITKTMIGGNSTFEEFLRIESRLEANILLLNDENEIKLIVVLDLLFVGPEITNLIRALVKDEIKQENIWISASHTHNAPMTDPNKPRLGRYEAQYTRYIQEKISACLKDLMNSSSDMIEVNALLRHGRKKLGVHRRRRRIITPTRKGLLFNRQYMGPAWWKKLDTSIRLIQLVSAEGIVEAVVWHYSCHPTSFPDEKAISSHFPGAIRERFRALEEKQIPVVYLQGFAGDIRPPSINGLRGNVVRWLQQGPQFRLFTEEEYRKWIARFLAGIENLKLEKETTQARVSVNSKRECFPAEIIVKGSKSKSLVIQHFVLGPIRLIGISAEPSNHLLSRRLVSSNPNIWLCGYLEDVFGYIPTMKQYREGGYESVGFTKDFACEELAYEGIQKVRDILSDLVST